LRQGELRERLATPLPGPRSREKKGARGKKKIQRLRAFRNRYRGGDIEGKKEFLNRGTSSPRKKDGRGKEVFEFSFVSKVQKARGQGYWGLGFSSTKVQDA